MISAFAPFPPLSDQNLNSIGDVDRLGLIAIGRLPRKPRSTGRVLQSKNS